MEKTMIIPDEWLIHDLIGANNQNRQKESLRFLDKIKKRCDKLIVLEESPFVRKIYRLLMKNNTPFIREISKYFRNTFLINSNKCRLLDKVEELPKNWEEKVPNEDYYLFQIVKNVPNSVLVTTDKELIAVSTSLGIEVRDRDEFIKKYLEND